jgi:urease accessory protein
MTLCVDGRLQRAVGYAQLGVRLGPDGTAIQTLRQSGCLNMRFPRTHGQDVEAVLINLSGGVADGDALSIALDAGDGTALTLCTPSAERIYRARAGARAAKIDTTVTIASGARLDYLPQETLLFEGCALNRCLMVNLDPKGSFLGVEARIFGRALHGESVATLRLSDRIVLHRGGRLILQDTLRLQGDVGGILAAPAGGAGCAAAATLLYAAPDAEGFLGPVRDALGGAQAGASAWNGVLLVRLLAPDGQALRRAFLPALKILVAKPLPRLWAS